MFQPRTARSAHALTHHTGYSLIFPASSHKMSSSQPYRSYPASSAQPFRSASAASSRPGPSSWLDIDPPLDLSALACAALDPSHLHEHDPDVQALYTTWSASRPPPPPYDASPLPNAAGVVALSRRNPWTTKAAAAWVLSQQLRDPGFEAYSLAQLIQHCGTAPFGPWHFIEARCPPGSSIRRFANHWVAWNASFTAGGSGAGEFAGLAATGLVARVVRGETRDPRTFELAHWFSACGDELAAKCDHDPVVRRRREWERARPPPKEKTPVVGRVDELKVQGRKNPVRSCWRFKRRLICSVSVFHVRGCYPQLLIADSAALLFTDPLPRCPELLGYSGRPSDRRRHPPSVRSAWFQPQLHTRRGTLWPGAVFVCLLPLAPVVCLLLRLLQHLRLCQRSNLGSRHSVVH